MTVGTWETVDTRSAVLEKKENNTCDEKSRQEIGIGIVRFLLCVKLDKCRVQRALYFVVFKALYGRIPFDNASAHTNSFSCWIFRFWSWFFLTRVSQTSRQIRVVQKCSREFQGYLAKSKNQKASQSRDKTCEACTKTKDTKRSATGAAQLKIKKGGLTSFSLPLSLFFSTELPSPFPFPPMCLLAFSASLLLGVSFRTRARSGSVATSGWQTTVDSTDPRCTHSISSISLSHFLANSGAN